MKKLIMGFIILFFVCVSTATNYNPSEPTKSVRRGLMSGNDLGLIAVLPCTLGSGDSVFTSWIHDNGRLNLYLISFGIDVNQKGSHVFSASKLYLEASYTGDASGAQLQDSLISGSAVATWDSLHYFLPLAPYYRFIFIPGDSSILYGLWWFTVGYTR